MALAGILVLASAVGFAWAQESGDSGLPAGDTASEAGRVKVVSLDRTAYPMPWKEHGGHDLVYPKKDLTIHVTINDGDQDVSSRIDMINPVQLKISIMQPDGDEYHLDLEDTKILETGPSTGVFEAAIQIPYKIGTYVLQAHDRIMVRYADEVVPGRDGRITVSADFELNDGKVHTQEDELYDPGVQIPVLLVDPDLDLDSKKIDVHPLNLLLKSHTISENVENEDYRKCVPVIHEYFNKGVFVPSGTELRETGNDTGEFEFEISIPDEFHGDPLVSGEPFTVMYSDYGTPDSDIVGGDHLYDSCSYRTGHGDSAFIKMTYFEPVIMLDQRGYASMDTVLIDLVAHEYNRDPGRVERIGGADILSGYVRQNSLVISIGDTKGRFADNSFPIKGYELYETGNDTGVFSGSVRLEASGDPTPPDPVAGPDDGVLPVDMLKLDNAPLYLALEFGHDGKVITRHATVQWEEAEIVWREPEYAHGKRAEFGLSDGDANRDHARHDKVRVSVTSDLDKDGVMVDALETGPNTGIFEGVIRLGNATADDTIKTWHGGSVTISYKDDTVKNKPHTMVMADARIADLPVHVPVTCEDGSLPVNGTCSLSAPVEIESQEEYRFGHGWTKGECRVGEGLTFNVCPEDPTPERDLEPPEGDQKTIVISGTKLVDADDKEVKGIDVGDRVYLKSKFQNTVDLPVTFTYVAEFIRTEDAETEGYEPEKTYHKSHLVKSGKSTVSHWWEPDQPGSYEIYLTVTDGGDLSNQLANPELRRVVVKGPPAPAKAPPPEEIVVQLGEVGGKLDIHALVRPAQEPEPPGEVEGIMLIKVVDADDTVVHLAIVEGKDGSVAFPLLPPGKYEVTAYQWSSLHRPYPLEEPETITILVEEPKE
ncbi:MAG: hypothetical protein MPK30_08545 [Gammaproteobacteria bacterium]|nr:hypothetical protein [Gammaproteobacteria bacterium]